MQDNKYYNTIAISSSSLKDFEWMTPLQWKETYIDKAAEKENKLHFNKGSFLDSLMLNPDSIEETFYIGDFKSKVSESIQTIVDTIYKRLLKEYGEQTCLINFAEEDETTNKIIVEYANYANYGNGGYKDERIIKEIREKGKEYFDFLCLANGRVIISTQDQLLALDKKHALLNTEYTHPYFVQQKDELLYHHLQIYTEDELKGELDILRIVPNEKRIYIPDLKTTHSAFQFLENVRKYSYATQLGFYKHLVKLLFSGTQCNLNKDIFMSPDFFNYEIICQNIVIDEKSMKPLIYQYSEEDLDYYQYGSEVMKKLYPYIRYRRGWQNTLEIIRWHIKNNLWDYPKEHYEKGHILLNLIR